MRSSHLFTPYPLIHSADQSSESLKSRGTHRQGRGSGRPPVGSLSQSEDVGHGRGHRLWTIREAQGPWRLGGGVVVSVLNRLVQFNVIRRYVKTNSVYTTHRLNALAAPPGIRV